MGWLALVAGCSGSGTTMPTDPDASATVPSDAPVGSHGDAQASSGLIVTWETTPTLAPIPIEGGGEIASAMFKLARCELIGDSTSGDERTTATNFVIGWTTIGSADPRFFPFAPPGRYSKLSLTMNATGGDWVYELTGTAKIMGTDEPFVIRDTQRVDIDESFDVTLPPGGTKVVRVKVDLADVVKNVDWDTVPVQNNVRELVAGPQLDDVRNRLKNAFDIAE
ncbi:MAG: hypothetical protein AB7O24_08020 [Kofleriaceae bacterium]